MTDLFVSGVRVRDETCEAKKQLIAATEREIGESFNPTEDYWVFSPGDRLNVKGALMAGHGGGSDD